MCTEWCYIRLVTCVALILMFMGSAREFAQGIYYDPYRVVFYKNGAVTYCVKSEG
jgi:hypothetical protein